MADGARSSIPVLMFHSLEERRGRSAFPIGLLGRCLAALRERDCVPVGLLQIASWLAGVGTVPARCFALTFDDGYRSFHERALPVLAEHGVSATVFALPPPAAGGGRRRFEGRELMSAGELRELSAAGVEIGAHTMAHPDLRRCSRAAVEAELAGSKAVLEDLLGQPVDTFAYPYGRFDVDARDAARRLFRCACSDRLGLVRRGSDPHALERVETHYLARAGLVGLAGSRQLPAYLALRRGPRAMRRIAGSQR